LRIGKTGPFIGCSNYPECKFTRSIAANGEGQTGDRELGLNPKSGATVWLKTGRFGPYVEEAGEPPKRANAPKQWPLESIDIDKALGLLALPRQVGAHPDDGEPIVAGIGRYGPYVLHAGTYANLSGVDEVFDVGLNRAVALLAEKRAGGARGRAEPKVLKELGNHPDSGEPVRVLSGRYGPYVKHQAVNANVPKDSDPADVTLEEAVALLAARQTRGTPRKGRTPRAKARKSPAARAKPRAR
jgi:DNA topoisomerase-1